ncbi:hypothetical protein RXS09_29495, partial [Pseudomonas aeruginosa]|nr:hypothetical protein [Pseudomonas aeruginosa]
MNDDPLKVEETTTPPSGEMETPADIDFNEDLPQEGDSDDAPRKKSAMGRINELVSQNKQLLDEVRGLKDKVETPPVYQNQSVPTP